MKRLVEMMEGEEGIVARIDGGDRLSRRLLALGIVPGARVRIIRNGKMGPIILDADGARIALGRGVAEKIWVEIA